MDKPQQPKQAYEKPSIARVRLARGELAAAGCKTASEKMGPTGGCFFSHCMDTGS